MKFIKLTEVFANGNEQAVILNCENIVSIKKSERSDDTHIAMKDTKYFFIREKPDQIWEMLITDYIKAPVIMTADEALKYYGARGL